MAKRIRRQTPDGDYSDPLRNYDAPEYSDGLEQALMEDDISALETTPIATVPPSATIAEAMRVMESLGCACVLVTANERLYGLFSERDVLNKVADRYEQIKDRPVAEVMTLDVLCAHETDSPAAVLNLMAVQGFRHVPILNVDEKLVGILGPRRVTHYIQEKFEQEE